VICPSCGDLHFDGSFVRCEDCREVERVNDILRGGSSADGFTAKQMQDLKTILETQQVPTTMLVSQEMWNDIVKWSEGEKPR
jgi:hypothetical protein